MSTPMTANQLQRQFEKWGVKAKYLPNWDSPTRGRDDETGLHFGPVEGCTTHHTGSDADDLINRKLIAEGRSDLPGPLAHFGMNDDGICDVHTIGRANHAGGGDGRVLAAMKTGSYGKYPIKTQKHQGSDGAADGNDVFYGMECYYSGAHEMTEAAYESMILVWAAICDFYGWTAKRVIGHKEWSDWKPDPGSEDMYQIRLDVDEALRLGPPSQRKADLRQVREARKALTMAIKALAEVDNDRKVVHDVRKRLQVQRSRLSKVE